MSLPLPSLEFPSRIRSTLSREGSGEEQSGALRHRLPACLSSYPRKPSSIAGTICTSRKYGTANIGLSRRVSMKSWYGCNSVVVIITTSLQKPENASASKYRMASAGYLASAAPRCVSASSRRAGRVSVSHASVACSRMKAVNHCAAIGLCSVNCVADGGGEGRCCVQQQSQRPRLADVEFLRAAPESVGNCGGCIRCWDFPRTATSRHRCVHQRHDRVDHAHIAALQLHAKSGREQPQAAFVAL